MAEYITLPATNLHLVPADLPDAMAAFAEPLAAACRILEQGILEQHEHSQQLVAVLGETWVLLWRGFICAGRSVTAVTEVIGIVSFVA